MEGIHVFNKVEILALPSWYFWVVLGLGILFMIIGSIMEDKGKHVVFRLIGGIIFLISFTAMMTFGCGWQYFQQPTGKYEYTVLIDDSKTNVLDFTNKYEIVRQEGELWIIKDK